MVAPLRRDEPVVGAAVLDDDWGHVVAGGTAGDEVGGSEEQEADGWGSVGEGEGGEGDG